MTVKAPYSGPFYGPSDPQKRGPDQSAYIIALKRGLSRWDGGQSLKWQQFNATYNLALENAVAAFKAHKEIDTPKYVWGQGAHNALLDALRKKGATDPQEPALDRTAILLMEDAYEKKYPGVRDLEIVHVKLSDYLTRMVVNKNRWDYRQQRPMKSIGVAPEAGGTDDCSSLPVAGCYWVRTKTGIKIPDPAGYGYSGYGNTVSLYMTNRDRKISINGTFQIGDLALYGFFASSHVVVCRKAGNKDTAIWASHGSQAGPLDCRVLYRYDLFAIVRPILSP